MSGALSASSMAAIMGVGAGVSAFGAYRNSEASQVAYGAQAQIASNNQQLANWQALEAIERGNRAATQVATRNKQTKGTQRAALAANGVDLTEGSALEILSDTDMFGELDVAATKDNAAREAWAIRQQAAGYGNEASLLKSRADSESPLFAAGTSLLTSAGRVAGSWYGRT